MSLEPTVGKNIVETLTLGMYTDPKIIFREYIQNAADSIDIAKGKGYYSKEKTPSIIINISSRNIYIEDNGTGIGRDKAASKLCDIGKSDKDYSEQRGFRGIGRLGGLAYCQKLTFSTSALNENEYTEVSFDCNKLKKYLSPLLYRDMTATDLIKEVTTINYGREKLDKHYFRINIENVNEPTLLDEKDVFNYLCVISPVKYHSTKFVMASMIYDLFKKYNIEYEGYDIYFNGKDVLKPYKTRFKVHKENLDDHIKNLIFFEHITDNEKNSFFGWYADCHMLGAVVDDLLKGMRVRKGNIQIGDETFSKVFLKKSNERFYSWIIGEVFVFDKGLIPNARRDSFETSNSFDAFKNSMGDYFSQIVKEIREKSAKRNDPINKKSIAVETILDGIGKAIKNGFKSKKELIKAKEDIDLATELASSIEDEISRLKDKKIIGEKQQAITELKEKIDSAASVLQFKSYFKADKLTTSLSRKEKNIVIEIFDQIYDDLEEELANQLIDAIISRLNKIGKKSK
jgi:molecular chaperone HtpG